VKRGRVLRGLLILVVVLVVAGIGGFLWYAQPQRLLPEASAALADSQAASFRQDPDGRITYTPTATAPTTGLVLYTGAKVPLPAYAPAARAIAEAGHLVALVPAPFGFAIFDVNAAQAVSLTTRRSRHGAAAVILGGAAAALFIDGHPGEADGLVLWASYSSADLADDGVIVSSSYGSLDIGVPAFTSPANVGRLGPALVVSVIDGGNHEQMGWYTGQPDDPPATIGRQVQQDRIVAATVELLNALEEPPLE